MDASILINTICNQFIFLPKYTGVVKFPMSPLLWNEVKELCGKIVYWEAEQHTSVIYFYHDNLFKPDCIGCFHLSMGYAVHNQFYKMLYEIGLKL